MDAIHGKPRATKIRNRMAEFRSAKSLMDFWPPKSGPSRCHELTKGKKAGQLSVDLDHPYRLIFVPCHNPLPLRTDGGLDWAKVTAITIIGVEDTHG
jgi:hypothetical protein